MILLVFNRFHILVRILLLETSDDWSGCFILKHQHALSANTRSRPHSRYSRRSISKQTIQKQGRVRKCLRSNDGSPIRLSYFPKKPLRLQPNPHGDLLCSTVSALDGVNHCCVGGFDGFGNFNFSHVLWVLGCFGRIGRDRLLRYSSTVVTGI